MSRVALVGSPNSGKTTLFNSLTGRSQKVVNYPGSTVDIAIGKSAGFETVEEVEFLDTPGTYSLFPKSPDEETTKKALFDKELRIEKLIVVLDSTQMARQLPLVTQVKETGYPFVVAVTMQDMHLKENKNINISELSQEIGAPVYAVQAFNGTGIQDLMSALKMLPAGNGSVRDIDPWSFPKYNQEILRSKEIARKVASEKLEAHARTAKVDDVLLHPVFGLAIFAAIMVGIFSSIYWAAAPAMDLVDGGFAALAEFSKEKLGEGLIGEFIADGVIVGVGSVLIFVPQIFILSLGICLLEDSGYLARAAALVDKPLSLIGLNGKAFVPLLSGFACAVPAMMATRSIQSRKEKWLTMLIIPLMTCSARLPVYALFVSFLFIDDPFKGGLLMAALYMGAIFFGALVAGIFAKLTKLSEKGLFALELPLYRMPRPYTVLKNTYYRTAAYVKKTAPVILVLAVTLWGLATFPNYQEKDPSVRLQESYVAKVGHVLEPVFEPMGGDWRVGVGLLTAFAAREVFVSSLAVVMNVSTDGEEESVTRNILATMKSATKANGQPLFTAASIAALLVFFMIALQCISTSSVAWREMASGKFAFGQTVFLNVLAYVLAVGTYQILS